MSEYFPDHWVVLKFTTQDKPFYKVLAGWGGSYLYGSSWQLNSGIVSVRDTDTHYLFRGYSGSVYTCRKAGYALRMSNAPAYEQIKKRLGDKVELMPEDTDWIALFKETENAV